MTEETTSAPAGAETGVAMPVSISSIDAAADMWTEAKEKAATAPETTTETVPEPAAAETQGTEEVAASGEPEQPGPETPPEDDALDIESIHGNRRFRFKPKPGESIGEEVTFAEMKKAAAERREFEQRRVAFEQEAERTRAQLNESAKQAQFASQVIPRAIEVLKAQLPEIPPLPPRGTGTNAPFDYIEALEARQLAIDDYNAKAAEIRSMEHLQQEERKKADAELHDQFVAYSQREAASILSRKPELRDPKKAEVFTRELAEAGSLLGYSADELNQIHDHRAILAIHELGQLKKAKAVAPPKPDPKPVAGTAAPVLTPGNRTTPAADAAARSADVFAQARAKGSLSLDEAVALRSQR